MGQIQLKVDALADASRQIQKAVPYMDALNLEPSSIESLQTLGQLYNGLIGTFGFSEDIEVFSKLREVAEIIDTVSRVYKSEENGPVTNQHIDFLNQAVNLSIDILGSMVEFGHISDDVKRQYRACLEDYSKLDDVNEKETLDQDDIDNLLDSL